MPAPWSVRLKSDSEIRIEKCPFIRSLRTQGSLKGSFGGLLCWCLSLHSVLRNSAESWVHPHLGFLLHGMIEELIAPLRLAPGHSRPVGLRITQCPGLCALSSRKVFQPFGMLESITCGSANHLWWPWDCVTQFFALHHCHQRIAASPSMLAWLIHLLAFGAGIF
jgi:hypothetical protein